MWTVEVLHVSNCIMCVSCRLGLRACIECMHRVSQARITAVLGCADAEASGGAVGDHATAVETE